MTLEEERLVAALYNSANGQGLMVLHNSVGVPGVGCGALVPSPPRLELCGIPMSDIACTFESLVKERDELAAEVRSLSVRLKRISDMIKSS